MHNPIKKRMKEIKGTAIYCYCCVGRKEKCPILIKFLKGIFNLWHLRVIGESPSPSERYQNSILARYLLGTIILESKAKNCKKWWEVVTPRPFILLYFSP